MGIEHEKRQIEHEKRQIEHNFARAKTKLHADHVALTKHFAAVRTERRSLRQQNKSLQKQLTNMLQKHSELKKRLGIQRHALSQHWSKHLHRFKAAAKKSQQAMERKLAIAEQRAALHEKDVHSARHKMKLVQLNSARVTKLFKKQLQEARRIEAVQEETMKTKLAAQRHRTYRRMRELRKSLVNAQVHLQDATKAATISKKSVLLLKRALADEKKKQKYRVRQAVLKAVDHFSQMQERINASKKQASTYRKLPLLLQQASSSLHSEKHLKKQHSKAQAASILAEGIATKKEVLTVREDARNLHTLTKGMTLLKERLSSLKLYAHHAHVLGINTPEIRSAMKSVKLQLGALQQESLKYVPHVG